MALTQAKFVEMTAPCKRSYDLVIRRNPIRAKICLKHIKTIFSELPPQQVDRHKDSLKPTLEYFARYGKLLGSPSKYLVGESGYGRLYIKQGKGYIALPRAVRHYLAHDLYSDHDMEDAHPRFSRPLMNLFNIDGTALDDWSTNRETYFRILMESSCKTIDRDDCKKVGFVFMYFGDLDFTFQELGIVDSKAAPVADVARRCQVAMRSLCDAIEKSYPQLWEDLPFDPTKDNPRAGKFSSLMQHIERHVMLICARVAKAKFSYEIGDFCHDGLFLSLNGAPVEDPEPFHQAAEYAVLAETGFSIRLVSKPLNVPTWARPLLDLETPEANTDDKAEGNSYAMALAKFNEKHCKISLKNCWVYEVDRFTHKILSTGEMKHEAAELVYQQEVSGPSGSTAYVECALVECKAFTRDPNKRIKMDLDLIPPPLVVPESTYNLWKPFAADTGDDALYTPKPDGLQRFRDHILLLCGHNPGSTSAPKTTPPTKAVLDSAAYFERWLGHMLLYPAEKSIMPVLISNDGAGKGSFVQYCTAILGRSRVLETANPAENVWGPFNDLMADAFLVVMEEIDKSQTLAGNDKLKNLVKDPTIQINIKCGIKYNMRSCHRFMLCTNTPDPTPTNKHDRRNFMNKCSDDRIGDTVYFDRLYADMADWDTIRTIYYYLISLPGLETFIRDPLPKTEYHKELIEGNRSYCAQWIQSFVDESKETTAVEYKASDLLKLYQTWAASLNLDCHLTPSKFGLQIKHAEIPGITTRKSSVAFYTFDFPVIRTYFAPELLV